MIGRRASARSRHGDNSASDEFFAYLHREYRYYKAVLGDPRTPSVGKWLIAGGVGYLMLPLDFVPDFIPFIGKLDDLLLVPALIGLGMTLVPDFVKQQNRERTRRLRLLNADGSVGPPLLDTQALPGPFGVAIHFCHRNVARLGKIAFPLLDLTLQYGLLSVTRHTADVISGDHQISGSQNPPPVTPYTAQTQLNVNFRPMPRIIGMLANRSVKHGVRFINTEAAYDAMPNKLKRPLEGIRLRWRPHANLRVDAVLPGKKQGDKAFTGAHVVSGAQFINLMLSGSSEAIVSKTETSYRLLDDVRNHVLRDAYCCARELTDGDLIAWDPRRVFFDDPEVEGVEPQFIYPIDVNQTYCVRKVSRFY